MITRDPSRTGVSLHRSDASASRHLRWRCRSYSFKRTAGSL